MAFFELLLWFLIPEILTLSFDSLCQSFLLWLLALCQWLPPNLFCFYADCSVLICRGKLYQLFSFPGCLSLFFPEFNCYHWVYASLVEYWPSKHNPWVWSLALQNNFKNYIKITWEAENTVCGKTWPDCLLTFLDMARQRDWNLGTNHSFDGLE